MTGKTGGTVAIGAMVASLVYMSAGLQRNDSGQAKQPAAVSSDRNQRTDADNAPDFDSVEVFYATDRALVGAAGLGPRHDLGAVGIATGLGVLAFTAWFHGRGKKKVALVIGIVGTGAAVALMFCGPALVAKSRGISAPASSDYCYGAERGELQMGACEVTIPRTHRVGEVESPSILRLELHASADRHVMLQRVLPQPEAEFFEAVQRRVQASPQRDLFVFVHGFNVSFESAARRTAQMAHDLQFEGAPIFYSWPSQAKPWEYTVDEANVVWSVPHLKQFLTDLSRESKAKSIHLIAHSMGSRALTQAIRELAYECKEDKKMFRQVILAAPDIDADVFREQIAPALARQATKVTLYASANDEALAASKLVHGSRRAGESASQPEVVAGIETVDVAIGELGLLGHSYYGSNRLILQDLGAILRESRPASLRPWLTQVGEGAARYWRFQVREPSNASRPVGATEVR